MNDTLTQGTGTKRLPKKQLKAVSDRLHKLYKEPTWSQKFQVHFRLSHLSINQQRWGWQAPRAHRPTQMEQTRREKQHAYDVMVALRKFHPAPQVRDRLKREKLATEQQQEVERQKANQGSRVKHNALMDSDDTSESMLGSMFG